MDVQTTCYSMLRHITDRRYVPVAISCGVPSWYAGKILLPFAPNREIVALDDDDEFVLAYCDLLNALDPEILRSQLESLRGNILLTCWCKRDIVLGRCRPNTVCHRRLAAEWLEYQFGIVVPEYGFDRKLCADFLKFI